jgi:hypothetical protein
MHQDAKSLKARGDHLFSAKAPLDSRNQEIADHFYPERADFTVTRDIGEDWADHLMTGYPSMIRRDLGNALGSMLRPRAKKWFSIAAEREENMDGEARGWMQWATDLQRRAMYDRKTKLTMAVKQGDHDFATFGGACISVEMNHRDMALLYRCWHLRDVAWAEDAFGSIGEIHRNWKPTVSEMCQYFPNTVHPKIKARKDKEPFATINVRHVVVRSDEYLNSTGKPTPRQPWMSLFIDCENDHILQETPSWHRIYVLPRWATISGSQYPYSPAALIALPDARLVQAMTLTMLDAGERAANPPMIGVAEAIRGDLQLYAGGFTSVDAEYDERLGEVMRPLTQDLRGLPFGMDMLDRQGEMIKNAFYLNQISMPPQGGPEMTAFEVGQRVQEYIRNALPLFEPMEDEYNGQLCDMTFEVLMRNGAFGSPQDIPESIQGENTTYEFESPLREMVDRQKGQNFLEAKAMITEAVQMDPSSAHVMDFRATLRDVLGGIGTPEKWLRSENDETAIVEDEKQKVAMAQQLEAMSQGGEAAEKLGAAAQQFAAPIQ